MTPLSLTLRRCALERIDMSPVTPDALQGLGRKSISGMRLQCGRQRHRLGDLFDITGRDAAVVEIRRSTAQLFHIGHGLQGGVVRVRGHAGDGLGERMQDGDITVHGNAGDRAGAGMTGGVITIHGHAGNQTGAALPGQITGMRNGLILVDGDAGDRVGERMRGGTIVVLGNVGAYMACRMAAGTVIAMGRTGPCPGLGMKRGTLVLGRRPRGTLPGFRSAGALKMEFLRLLFKQLGSTRRGLAPFRAFGPEAIRLAGDLSAGGKGEILILLNASQGSPL